MTEDRTQRPETLEERMQVLRDVISECSEGIVKDINDWLEHTDPEVRMRALQRLFMSSNTIRTASYNLLRNVEPQLRVESQLRAQKLKEERAQKAAEARQELADAVAKANQQGEPQS